MEVITLKKMAKMLNLSISTISRALKNHPDISVATKKRVNEFAETFDYQPNINAVSLRSQKSKVLGLIVPSVSGFFYDSFISAIEKECRRNKYSLMILQTGNHLDIELENLKFCKQNRLAGLFMCLSTETTTMDVFQKFEEADIPIVFFDKVPDEKGFNKICISDEKAAILAAELLITKNKKNILGIFGIDSLSITKLRFAAFKNKLVENKAIKFNYTNCESPIEAKKVVLEYITSGKKLDAIFCMSDEILIGVVKALHEMKINIPNDVAVIALSDGFIPKLYTPEITYVETSGYKLGKLAYSKMATCLNGNKNIETLFAPSHIVAGNSL